MTSAQGPAASRQTTKELAGPLGGALDPGPVVREFLKSLVAAVSLVAFAPLLIAQERSEEPLIRGAGCLAPGVEGGCTVVTDKKSGQTYTVFFSSKKLPKGNAAISFEGVEHRGMTTCMQGKAVDVSKWSYVKLRCPTH